MKAWIAAAIAAVTFTAHGNQSTTIRLPEFQQAFLTTVDTFAGLYDKATNELKRSALEKERLKELRKLKGSPRKISGWYGILEKMGTTGEGKAYISVRMPGDRASVSTWNNSFSDGTDKTLIGQDSPLYGKLSEMEEGNVIKFSGRLIRPTNLTEQGRMIEPNFLFVFSEIDKVGDRLSK